MLGEPSSMTLLKMPDLDPATFAKWLTLLDIAPASWAEMIPWHVTRSTLKRALSESVVKSVSTDNRPGLCSFRYEVLGGTTAHPIGFMLEKSCAKLSVTETGELYEAVLDDSRPSVYPFSSDSSRRTMKSDIVHEFGHAVVAHHLGIEVKYIRIPSIDLIQDPAVSYGTAGTTTRDLIDEDAPAVARIAIAGAVAEMLFKCEAEKLANALRLFGSNSDYWVDFGIAQHALGSAFSETLFHSIVDEVTEILRPQLPKIVESVDRIISDARQRQLTDLEIPWSTHAEHFCETSAQ